MINPITSGGNSLTRDRTYIKSVKRFSNLLRLWCPCGGEAAVGYLLAALGSDVLYHLQNYVANKLCRQ
jgi:hypothetical protein